MAGNDNQGNLKKGDKSVNDEGKMRQGSNEDINLLSENCTLYNSNET